MPMTLTPLTPAVGVEIGNVDLTALSAAEFAQIEAAWHRHSVLLFRGQKLSDDNLLAFSRRFGELDPPPNQERGRQSPPGYPDIYVVSNVLDDKGQPIGALGAEALRSAIARVLAGEMWTPPDVELAGPADADTAALIRRLATLTPQQVRVLMMLSGGLLNKQIAYELGVSEATVKAHVSAILQKLGVDSRTQAVIAAGKIETGQWPLK